MKFAPARVELEKRADGSMLLRSPQELRPSARCVTEWLVRSSQGEKSADAPAGCGTCGNPAGPGACRFN